MKSITQLVLAGVLGGAIAFGAFKFFDKDTVIYQELPSPVRQVSTVTTGVVDFSKDFVAAAERANPAVVHISAENEEYAAYRNGQRRSRSFYEDFWGFRRGEQPQAGTGSGVLIDEGGTIVTNNHVVGFADILKE